MNIAMDQTSGLDRHDHLGCHPGCADKPGILLTAWHLDTHVWLPGP